MAYKIKVLSFAPPYSIDPLEFSPIDDIEYESKENALKAAISMAEADIEKLNNNAKGKPFKLAKYLVQGDVVSIELDACQILNYFLVERRA